MNSQTEHTVSVLPIYDSTPWTKITLGPNHPSNRSFRLNLRFFKFTVLFISWPKLACEQHTYFRSQARLTGLAQFSRSRLTSKSSHEIWRGPKFLFSANLVWRKPDDIDLLFLPKIVSIYICVFWLPQNKNKSRDILMTSQNCCFGFCAVRNFLFQIFFFFSFRQ